MNGMIEGILETALYVDDLDRAEAFYGGILRLEKIARADNRHLFYRCGGGVLLLFNAEETSRPSGDAQLPVPPHGASGPGHMCFRLSAEAFGPMKDALAAAGVAIEADFYWPNGGRSIYFRDPAGNSLECAEAVIWNM